jgi:translation initiation factor IF-3
VKVTIMFRGREVTHPERGVAILDRLAEELAELGVVEQRPTQDGRNMTMMLGPSKAVLAGRVDGHDHDGDGAAAAGEPAAAAVPEPGGAVAPAPVEVSTDGAVKVEVQAPADVAAPPPDSHNGASGDAVS